MSADWSTDPPASNGIELRLSEVLVGALARAGHHRGPAPRPRRAHLPDRDAARRGDRARRGDAARRSFYALLLKDAGCSSNAAQVAALFGADDATSSARGRLTDTSSTRRVARAPGRATAAPGARRSQRRATSAAVLRSGRAGARRWSRCAASAAPTSPARSGSARSPPQAIRRRRRALGRPRLPGGVCRRAISLVGRILCLAQTAEVYWQHGGPAAACEVARKRRGTLVRPGAGRRARGARARRRVLGARCRSRRCRRSSRPTAWWSPTTTGSTASPRRSRGSSTPSRPTPPGTPPGVAEIAVALATLLGDRPRRDGDRPPRGAAARHRQARRLQPDPRQARPARPTDEWAVMRRHPALVAGDPHARPGVRRRWPGSPPPTTSGWTAAATSRGLTGARARPGVADPGRRRRGRGAQRQPALPPGAGPRRGAEHHGPRRRPLARRRGVRGAR